MPQLPDEITIGELAARSGMTTSALRFYEERGLLSPTRTSGNQRRYARVALRRVAFIRAAQQLGLSLDEVADALARLPTDRTPGKADWGRLSRAWRERLDTRIRDLERLRDDLTGCIGCGCLSLTTCRLLNTDDAAAATGPGARYLIDGQPASRRAAGTEPGANPKRNGSEAGADRPRARAKRADGRGR